MVNKEQYLVITDIDTGFGKQTEVIRVRSFRSAVDVYRRNTDDYGPFSCQIAKVVVDYGEAL